MATENVVDLTVDVNSGAHVSACPDSQSQNLGTIMFGNGVTQSIPLEPPLQVQPDLVHADRYKNDKLSINSILFSDPLLKWSSISIGAYIGSFLRIGLTYLKIWLV
jgi:hypothetical protein